MSFGYPGRIYPVNPRADEVLGLKAYARIGDIPEPVDYVICAVPSQAAPEIMRECVAARARVVSLFTAGFSEVGEDSAALEAEVVRMAPESLTEGFRMVSEASRDLDKPAVIILSTSNCAEAETKAWELQKRCLEQGTPVYITFEQAARAVNHVISYHERRSTEASPRLKRR